jgi:hypothetical protein
MATTTDPRYPTGVAPTAAEREEAPGLEVLRRTLQVLFAVSLAVTTVLVLAVVPMWLAFIPTLVAILCYLGLGAIARAQHRRWLARHAAPRGEGRIVGARVVAGGAPSDATDEGDVTADEPRPVAAASLAPGVTAAGATEPAGRAAWFTPPQRAGLRVGLEILGIVLVLGLILAGALFRLPMFAAGAVIVLLFMALFGLPVWLASVEDAAEEKKLHPGRR